MTQRVIPLADERQLRQLPAIPAELPAPTGQLLDSRGRPIKDLRISVTDRCNFRCVYCMPKAVFDKDYAFLPRESLLSFEEITRLARLFAAHGVTKIRLTGGEPLLRRNLEKLIAQLVEIPDMEVTLTTNGVLLPKKAAALKAAGLKRVTVSLDSLDDAVFRAMNDMDVPVSDVLKGIEAAEAAGLGPIKINMVVKRGLNDQEILPMARRFRGSGHILRFIEFMDVGSSNGWRMDDVVPSAEVVQRIHEAFPLEQIDPNYTGEVAERWRYADGSGEIGVISSVTQAFCSTCTRARLSTEGRLYTCLFAQSGHDLRALMRAQRSDAELSAVIGQIWSGRSDRYSEIRSAETASLRKIEMSYIGG
ncbi:MAG: GTP 3',8-cyclase MoaA [Zoogloea oleivorans]|jgi:cyclic pyranopterin phosphate synthase|uniref:GTP 3',8-cyclase MoaA n=1 Tax=Zoogloea oleivorans TaxID=1552750 RepID=UPI002A358FE0|nr:GTP 3',8-cyclase MoaA [Zoogloea oleivorans]MDY0035641.1 GTP 3',8-cyclase MoaA [Zoogloea oleivorans]